MNAIKRTRRGTRKNALVSQFLERISGDALEEYQEFFREFARRRNGVYALYRNRRLYYVGLARDLRGRLKSHLRDRHSKKWDRFSVYLTVGDDHIRELESLVIRIVRPTGNRQVGKFPRAQNLRRELSRRIMQEDKRRRDKLLGREMARPVTSRRNRPKTRAGEPVMAHWFSKHTALRGEYKGELFKAHIRRDGRIVCRGKIFDAPSLAAREAIGRKRAMNGWWFWRFERAPGDWVRLRELRR